jgi:hypothetical protein
VRRLKLRTIISAIAIILLPGLAFADGIFSLRLQGGWAHSSAGDINPGTQAFFDWRETLWPASEYGYRAMHNGFELGGDIIFELTPWLGVGIGGGYLKISGYSRMNLYDPELIGPSAGLEVKPTLSAVPIRAGVHLTIPLNSKFNFLAEIGASYYFIAHYSDEWWDRVWVFEGQSAYVHISTRAEKKKAPFGFQGGIGLEYELKHNFFLYLDARGRYARFRGWKGTSVLQSDYETPFSEQGILYYESVPMLSGSPRLIMVQSDPPDGPEGEPRQAAIDFSGVSLQVGIRIRL